MAIHGINHITLRVQNLEVAENFYVGVLGLKRVGQRTRMRFYSSGQHAHELALVEDPSFRHGNNQGLLHFCFNVSSETVLRELYQHCLTTGVHVSDGVNHVVMHSFYLRDPDGYTIEIGVDQPTHEWENNRNAFIADGPLSL